MKLIRKRHGFSLFEAIFVVGFMAVLFALLYHALTVSMRTQSAIFNNDDAVKKNAYAFAEILARNMRQTLPPMIMVYPNTSSASPDKPNRFLETRAVSFIFTGKAPYFNPGSISLFEDSFEKMQLPGETSLLGAAGMDVFAVYYYDKDGEIFGEKNAFYEILASLNTEGQFFKRKGSTKSLAELEEEVKTFATVARGYKAGYRKIAGNMVFFDISLDSYPVINVDSSFYYGKGGTSSKVSQGNISNQSKVFDLDFQVLPGL